MIADSTADHQLRMLIFAFWPLYCIKHAYDTIARDRLDSFFIYRPTWNRNKCVANVCGKETVWREETLSFTLDSCSNIGISARKHNTLVVFHFVRVVL